MKGEVSTSKDPKQGIKGKSKIELTSESTYIQSWVVSGQFIDDPGRVPFGPSHGSWVHLGVGLGCLLGVECPSGKARVCADCRSNGVGFPAGGSSVPDVEPGFGVESSGPLGCGSCPTVKFGAHSLGV